MLDASIMLEKLKLKNFQCHSSLCVEFDKKITAIVGPSDSGKSSVIRAIRWLSQNRPLGLGMIQYESSGASVFLSVDGVDIRRDRTKTKNSYLIRNNNNVNRMDSVGADVPDCVQNILNLGAENIQGQHDGPFWFNLSAGDVAKNLNRITNLELIDSTIQKLNEKVRKANYGVTIAEKSLSKAKEQFEKLSYVPDLEKDFSSLEELDTKIFDIKDEIDWLGKKNKVSREYTETINNNTQFLRDSETLVNLADELMTVEKPLGKLGKLIKNIKDLEDKIKEVPDITPLESIVVDVKNTSSEMADIKYRLREVWDRQKLVKQATTEYRRAKNKLKDELGNRCPLCGGKLNESDRSIVL